MSKLLFLLLSLVVSQTAAAWLDPFTERESMGPSSRRTGLVISEIMYASPVGADFIELFNSQEVARDISGYQLSGSFQFTFPEATTIGAKTYLVISPASTITANHYQLTGILGTDAGELPDDGGKVELANRAGALLLQIKYAAKNPRAPSVPGAAYSLILQRPSYGENDPSAWAVGSQSGGTPGRGETLGDSPYAGVSINEILAQGGNEQNFVEFYNSSSDQVDLSECVFSDRVSQGAFRFPPGTVIAPGGFLLLSEVESQLPLNSDGGWVALENADRSALIDAVYYGSARRNQSTGRLPHGFVPLERPTPGNGNAAPWHPSVIINEVMYHPLRNDRDYEYVELFNRATLPADLSNWRFVEGIEFTFPAGSVIPPRGWLVVARNAARLRMVYPGVPNAVILGDFRGNLANEGERVVLAQPGSAGGFDPVNAVDYGDGSLWGLWADGGGSSLEVRDPDAENYSAWNWRDSDESRKGTWTMVERTGILDHGLGSADALQLVSLGAGEYLIDDVEVLQGGVNHVSNGDFSSGISGWSSLGNHAVAPGNGGTLQLIATGRGDTGPNSVSISLTSALRVGEPALIRAQVRWLKGEPEILLRLKGNYLEAAGALQIDPALGTPAQPNSRHSPPGAPPIGRVIHRPLLPDPEENVTVLVEVPPNNAPSNIQPKLHYRLDPDTGYTTVGLEETTLTGTVSAGGRVYSAIIPGQPGGSMVAFYVETFGPNGTESDRYPKSPDECLVRFGETIPAGTLATYRLWVSGKNFQKWQNRRPLDNSPIDATFVYNNDRVIYNAAVLYAGSPHIAPSYNSPTGNLAGYVVQFPTGERFLGAKELVLDWPSRDASKVQEHTVYWMAEQLGLPYLHRRFIHLHINGVTEKDRGGIYEDAQQVNSDYIESWYPQDDDGELHKIEQWFEFNSAGQATVIVAPKLEDFRSADGSRKLERYRWTWLKRAAQGSASDYQALFALVDAVQVPDPSAYEQAINAIVDVEEWMKIFALEHIVGNFDSYGHLIGKNMYAYKPLSGKWQMHMWDIDWLMNASSAFGITPQAPLFDTEDPVIARMYNFPAFRRAYFRAVEDTVAGPLQQVKFGNFMDQWREVLVSNGVPAGSTSPGKDWLRQRRDYLVGQLATVAAPFSLTSPTVRSFVTNNFIEVRGLAPIALKSFFVNGTEVHPAWETVSNWTLRLPLVRGLNQITITGRNSRQQPLPGASANLEVFRERSVNPELFISTGATAVVVKWSGSQKDRFRLQSTEALLPGAWRDVPAPTEKESLWTNSVSDSFDGQQRFYRLRQE